MPEQKFDQWALVEIFGHQKVAGHVTEELIGGTSLLRVDIPTGDGPDDFMTQYLSGGSVFRMTPVTEEVVRLAVKRFDFRPPHIIGLPSPTTVEADELGSFDDHSF